MNRCFLSCLDVVRWNLDSLMFNLTYKLNSLLTWWQCTRTFSHLYLVALVIFLLGKKISLQLTTFHWASPSDLEACTLAKKRLHGINMPFTSHSLYGVPLSELHRNKSITVNSAFLPKVNQNAPYLGGLEWFWFFPLSLLSNFWINTLVIYQVPSVCLCAAGE